jgi:DNA polymerase-4
MASGAANILHADLDAFYAAVEVRNRPELAGLPVAVGGGVVLSATYEARRTGVRSGMGGNQARKLCPGLVVVDGHFADYVDESRRVMAIFEEFTPLVEPISIDEAFLDVTGSVHLFGSPVGIAAELRRRVRGRTGLTISVGVATTKHLAKVASRWAKPDGLLAVPPGRELAFLHPLPVNALWGVGPVGTERLARYGLTTVGDLAAVPVDTLMAWLGEASGRHLWALAHNRDPRPVRPGRRAGSVGAQSAFGRGGDDRGVRRRVLLGLADRVGSRLRRKGMGGRRITVRARLRGAGTVTRAQVLPGPVAATSSIFRAAVPMAEILVAERAVDTSINLLGISMSKLERVPVVQLELPMDGLPGDPSIRPGAPMAIRFGDADDAVDAARDRFGSQAVRRAALPARPEQRAPNPDALDR